MNISFISYENISDLNIPIEGKNKSYFLFYYLSGKNIDKSAVESILADNDCKLSIVRDIRFTNESQKRFIEEYLRWLSNVPDSKILGKSIKEWFVFDNKFSLWWLTSSSQRKKNKAVLPHFMEFIFLFDEIINELNTSNIEQNVLIIFDDSKYISVAEKLIDNYKKRNGVELNIESLIDKDGFYVRKNILGNFVEQVLFFMKTWVKLLRIHNFLRKAYKCKTKNTDENIVLLISDISDLTVDNRKYKNTYFPDLQSEFIARNVKLEAVYCDKNDLMDKKKWDLVNASGFSLEGNNNYHLLYPGIFSLLRVAVSSVKWIFLSRIIFWFDAQGEVYQYKGFNLKKIIRDDFFKLTLRQASLLNYYYCCWKKILLRLKPKAVLYRKEFNSFGRVISASAIPGTVMIGIQHGMVNNDQYGYLYQENEIDIKSSSGSDFIKYCPSPDKVAVFGKRMQDYMLSTGFPKKKIEVIGSLRHDKIIKKFSYPKIDLVLQEKLYKKFKVPKNSFVITLCGQWAKSTGCWFEIVVNALKDMDINAYLLIKPHPLELAETKNIINSFSDKLKFYEYEYLTESIEEVMYISNVAITHSSTAGIDALLVGVPVITIHQNGLPNNNELFASSSACFEVFNEVDMQSVLYELSGDNYNFNKWQKSRIEFLEYNLKNMDGKAHDRLIELFE